MSSENQINENRAEVIDLKSHKLHTQDSTLQSPVQRLARIVTKEARRNRMNYDQLRRVFVLCRKALDLAPPKEKLGTIRIPTTDEMKRFLAAQPPEHRLIFSFLIGSGLRVFEACNALVEDLDLSQNTLFIRNGKGGKSRVVTFGNRLKRELEIWLAGKNQKYIFESSRNTKWSKRSIQALAERYSAKSGVKVRCHDLRHAYCSRLASGTPNAPGLSEASRATLMGHSKASTSVLQARYTTISLEGIKSQAIAVLDDFEN